MLRVRRPSKPRRPLIPKPKLAMAAGWPPGAGSSTAGQSGHASAGPPAPRPSRAGGGRRAAVDGRRLLMPAPLPIPLPSRLRPLPGRWRRRRRPAFRPLRPLQPGPAGPRRPARRRGRLVRRLDECDGSGSTHQPAALSATDSSPALFTCCRFDPFWTPGAQAASRRRLNGPPGERAGAPGAEAGGGAGTEDTPHPRMREPYTVGSAGWTRSIPCDFIEASCDGLALFNSCGCWLQQAARLPTRLPAPVCPTSLLSGLPACAHPQREKEYIVRADMPGAKKASSGCAVLLAQPPSPPARPAALARQPIPVPPLLSAQAEIHVEVHDGTVLRFGHNPGSGEYRARLLLPRTRAGAATPARRAARPPAPVLHSRPSVLLKHHRAREGGPRGGRHLPPLGAGAQTDGRMPLLLAGAASCCAARPQAAPIPAVAPRRSPPSATATCACPTVRHCNACTPPGPPAPHMPPARRRWPATQSLAHPATQLPPRSTPAADADMSAEIKASYEDGVLSVVIPKKSERRPESKAIEVA